MIIIAAPYIDYTGLSAQPINHSVHTRACTAASSVITMIAYTAILRHWRSSVAACISQAYM